MIDKCNVCGKETEVYVRASSMGAVSLAYCKDCLEEGLEPYYAMVAYISCAGRFPEDINEAYRERVRYILKKLNISEEKFIEDVNKSIEDMNEYYNNMKSELEYED